MVLTVGFSLILFSVLDVWTCGGGRDLYESCSAPINLKEKATDEETSRGKLEFLISTKIGEASK